MDNTGRIYISKDVVFNESNFPYVTLFPSTAGTSTHSSTTVAVPITILPQQPVLDTPVPTSTTILASQPSAQSAPNLPPTHSTQPTSTHSLPSESTSAATPSSEPATPSTTTPNTSTTPPAVQQSNPPLHSQNIHPMQTRSKTGSAQPRINPTLLIAHLEPKTAKQALSQPVWHNAMKIEFEALLNNNTWTLVHLPPNRNAIGCKWVFRVKENPDGSINKYKARLVAKGFHQRLGYDYNETFSPVIKPVTVRLILTLAVTFRWPIQQLDVNNAFLNGLLDEEVFMVQPPGFESVNKHLVCKLNKAIYGLKQAPRAWFDKLKATLISFTFQPSKCDPSLFVFSQDSKIIYILFM